MTTQTTLDMQRELESEFTRLGNDSLGSCSSIVVSVVEIDGELWVCYRDRILDAI